MYFFEDERFFLLFFSFFFFFLNFLDLPWSKAELGNYTIAVEVEEVEHYKLLKKKIPLTENPIVKIKYKMEIGIEDPLSKDI